MEKDHLVTLSEWLTTSKPMKICTIAFRSDKKKCVSDFKKRNIENNILEYA